MLKKLYETLYLKVLVNIVIGDTKTIIYIEMLNKKGVVSANEKVFDTKYLSREMYEFIGTYISETPFYYISILDNSSSQGVIPSCSKQKVASFYDVSACEYKCYDKKWTYYTAKSDIYAIEKVYEKTGVDFIFSPFIVLSNFFKDKIESHLAMFILLDEGSISLSIFNNSELLFGQYIDVHADLESEDMLIDDNEEMDLQDIDLDEEDSIDLDDIDTIDDIDELDDFSDIADLDSIDDIVEFSETKDVEEELADREDAQEHPIVESNGLNKDYQRFVLIQSAVNSFYRDEKFDSEFIENVYIADSAGVTSDLKKYLEEESF